MFCWQVYDEDSLYFVNDYHTDVFLYSFIHMRQRLPYRFVSI